MKAEVITKSEKEYVVVLGGHEIGTSKHRFDADLHANVINNALSAEYENGRNAKCGDCGGPEHKGTEYCPAREDGGYG